MTITELKEIQRQLPDNATVTDLKHIYNLYALCDMELEIRNYAKALTYIIKVEAYIKQIKDNNDENTGI